MKQTDKLEVKRRNNDIDIIVSKNVHLRRVLMGFSQKDLARVLSVSIQQIQKYEKATNRISAGNLFKLAKFLKVDIRSFYNRHEYELKNPDKTRNILSLFTSLNELDDRKLEKYLLDLVKHISISKNFPL